MPRVYGSPAAGPAAPTPGVFGDCTILCGSGIESDPYIVLYVADASNFNSATVTPNITFPQSPTGMLRMRFIGISYEGATAGVVMRPYASVSDTLLGAAVPVPLGHRTVTTSVSDRWVYEECVGLELATFSGVKGAINGVTPFRFDMTGYAVTDDMYITIEFEWWS